MTNNEFMEMYINGTIDIGACNHLACGKGELINYSTTICVLDRETKTARVNTAKYSRTTGKIQNALLRLLAADNWNIETYEGEPCRYWNYGYMGAENWTVKEAKEIWK